MKKQKVDKGKLRRKIWEMSDEAKMNLLADFGIPFYYEDNLNDLLFNSTKNQKWMVDKILK